jgi:hypothetical protein
MESTKPKRRWYQFSLKSLLVLMAIAAIAIAWYTHRQRILNGERAKIVGNWDFGPPFPNGVMTFSETDFDVEMPKDGIGRIIFHSTAGDSLGIYRILGNKLEVAQNEVGKPWPESFDKSRYSVWNAVKIEHGSENKSRDHTP